MSTLGRLRAWGRRLVGATSHDDLADLHHGITELQHALEATNTTVANLHAETTRLATRLAEVAEHHQGSIKQIDTELGLLRATLAEHSARLDNLADSPLMGASDPTGTDNNGS